MAITAGFLPDAPASPPSGCAPETSQRALDDRLPSRRSRYRNGERFVPRMGGVFSTLTSREVRKRSGLRRRVDQATTACWRERRSGSARRDGARVPLAERAPGFSGNPSKMVTGVPLPASSILQRSYTLNRCILFLPDGRLCARHRPLGERPESTGTRIRRAARVAATHRRGIGRRGSTARDANRRECPRPASAAVCRLRSRPAPADIAWSHERKPAPASSPGASTLRSSNSPVFLE